MTAEVSVNHSYKKCCTLAEVIMRKLTDKPTPSCFLGPYLPCSALMYGFLSDRTAAGWTAAVNHLITSDCLWQLWWGWINIRVLLFFLQWHLPAGVSVFIRITLNLKNLPVMSCFAIRWVQKDHWQGFWEQSQLGMPLLIFAQCNILKCHVPVRSWETRVTPGIFNSI